MSKARVSQNTNRNNMSSLSTNTSSVGVNAFKHKEFLKRVETFNALKWHIKRRDINPLLCARFGWQCVEQNTLQCSGCGTKINYKTNPSWNIDTNNKMASSFVENLKCSHTSQCKWRHNPCNKSFEQLPNNPVIMTQQLMENICTWTPNTAKHPNICYPQIDLKVKDSIISSKEWNINVINNEICFDILILSCCGWYLTHNKYIQCRYCNKCISFKQSYHFNTINHQLFDHDHDHQIHNNEMDTIDTMEQIRQSIEPINETESIIQRLSKLGLKIDANIPRLHSFHVYETQTLQKQADFNNNNQNNNNKNKKPIFGAFNKQNNSNWPKKSVFNQVKKKAYKNKNKNKKRRRNEMSFDMDYKNNNHNCVGNSQFPLRKKMRICSTNCIQNNNNNNNELNTYRNDKIRIRKNRKRKTMDSESDALNNNNNNNNNEMVAIKKRRISSENNPNILKRKRNLKTRKRKFNDVFATDRNNVKRVRLDIGKKERNDLLYFDAINLHNSHCPFKTKNKYQENNQCIYGWNYCLKLLPNDIIYIQQIIKQTKKGNQARNRF